MRLKGLEISMTSDEQHASPVSLALCSSKAIEIARKVSAYDPWYFLPACACSVIH